jgi:hypothetical protein
LAGTENAYLRAWFSLPWWRKEETQSEPAARELTVLGVGLYADGLRAGPVERENGPRQPFVIGGSYVNSPRRSHLVKAGERLMIGGKLMDRTRPGPVLKFTLADDGSGTHLTAGGDSPQGPPREPIFSLLKTFSSHTTDTELMTKLAAYFVRVELQAGEILWRQGDQPDGLYVIESGVLQANYEFAAHSAPVQEVRP